MGPTSPTTAFRLGEKAADPVQMYLSDIYTIAVNLAGLPGMSIPCGFDAQGLPVGLQIIGNYFREAQMLNVAHQYQLATDWHLRAAARRDIELNMKWETVIGLEVHAQLNTRSKIFSGASTAFGAAPNTQASAVDIALPGRAAGAQPRGGREGDPLRPRGRRAGEPALDLRAQELLLSRPSEGLPDQPVRDPDRRRAASVEHRRRTSAEKTVRLTRAHLEEDAGKSLHEDFHGATGIDLNRAGTPLLEIVSEPDMRSSAEAVAYAKALHGLVRWIDICDGNMQEGSFRCDANVSVRPAGSDTLGTRCEIKNLNSFRFLERAIEFEVRRQIELIEDGGTRRAGDAALRSRPRRDAPDAQQGGRARLPLLPRSGPAAARGLASSGSTQVKAALPELPQAKRERFVAAYAITPYDAAVLTGEPRARGLLRGGRRGRARARSRKLCANWIAGALSARLNEAGPRHRREPGDARGSCGGSSSASPTARSRARSRGTCSTRCGRAKRRETMPRTRSSRRGA